MWVGGEQDIATKAALTATVVRAARLDDVPLLMDLSAVTFMDASTVGAILGSRSLLRSRAQTLEVRAPSPAALRVLELCGLSSLVHREPRSAGAGGALSSWVTVAPIERSGTIDEKAEQVAVRPQASKQARARARANLHQRAATTADADSGGP